RKPSTLNWPIYWLAMEPNFKLVFRENLVAIKTNPFGFRVRGVAYSPNHAKSPSTSLTAPHRPTFRISQTSKAFSG
ncbi:MAG: hypothetical protein VB138_14855, partial [Burkholderia sp.]